VAPTPEFLLQRLVAGLQARGGNAQVSQLGQDPEIREASRGVANKLTKFLEKHPDVFLVGPPGENGDLTVGLVGPPGENGDLTVGLLSGPELLSAPIPVQDGQQVLMEQIASVIEESGGTCSMSSLGCHPGVKEHRKGVAASLSKFLASYPDIFEKVSDSSDGDTTWSLVNGWNASPSFTGSGHPEANCVTGCSSLPKNGESVRQVVVRFLEARGGEATLGTLGESFTIRQSLRAVGLAKISKFLHQHPETFEVVLVGDPAVPTCRLVNTFV